MTGCRAIRYERAASRCPADAQQRARAVAQRPALPEIVGAAKNSASRSPAPTIFWPSIPVTAVGGRAVSGLHWCSCAPPFTLRRRLDLGRRQRVEVRLEARDAHERAPSGLAGFDLPATEQAIHFSLADRQKFTRSRERNQRRFDDDLNIGFAKCRRDGDPFDLDFVIWRFSIGTLVLRPLRTIAPKARRREAPRKSSRGFIVLPRTSAASPSSAWRSSRPTPPSSGVAC